VAEVAKDAFLAGEGASTTTITINNTALRVSFVINISFVVWGRNYLITPISLRGGLCYKPICAEIHSVEWMFGGAQVELFSHDLQST
jgi:hypothetical protein